MENIFELPLLEEALFLYDQGIKVFLSDPATKRPIGRFSEFDPVTDREHLIELCTDNAEANLEVVIDKEHELLALGVGIGTWRDNAEESFRELLDQYGPPATLSYQMPDGARYYLFKPGSEELKVQANSGLSVLKSCESLSVFPSVIEGRQVKKLGTTAGVQRLSDWLAGTGSCPITGNDGVSEGLPGEDVPPEHEPQAPLCATVQGAEIATEEEIEPSASGEEEVIVAVPDPVSALRQEVTAWIAGGNDKASILAQALHWNKRQGEPVQIEELVSLVEELLNPGVKEEPVLSDEDLLFKIAEEMTLMHDQLAEPYFFFEGEAFQASSKHIEARLKYHFLKATHHLPKAKTLKDVIGILESRARFESLRVTLNNRVSEDCGAFFYDLRDKRYLKATPEKWEIIPAFPLFRRYQHQQPQVEPVSGGDPWEVFDFLTVDGQNQLLIMVYLISLFVPRIPHPVLAVFGDQGAAKSFLCTVINRLVDPTLTERIIQPRNERDLIQTLRQKYVTVLDNLSKIDDRVSDIFCQVCTGGGISFRKLYTDEGENIAQFRHVVILNSINLAIVNADLMDRSIILKCHRIDAKDRKAEEELWDAFEAARPRILGGIFDTLVKAMAIYPTVQVERLPRLADFAKWGYAIAEALGKGGDQFLEDFTQNVRRQNQSVAEKNVLCQVILRHMADREASLMKVGEAHRTFKKIAADDARDTTFPKLPHNLREKLDRLKSTLSEHGITYDYLDRKKDGVQILFSKSASPDTPQTESAVLTPATAIEGEPDEAGEAHDGLPVVEFTEIYGAANG